MNKVIAQFGTKLETVLHGDHHIITTVKLPDGLEAMNAGVLLYKEAGEYKPLKKADTSKSPVAVIIDDVAGPTSASVANVAVHGAIRTDKLVYADGGPISQEMVDKLATAGIYAIGELLAEAVAPVIHLQPEATTTVAQNESVTLYVGASAVDGGKITYQWYKNGSNSDTGGTPVPAGNSSALSVDTSAVATSYFYCEVTNTKNNTTKTVKSSVATVEVTA
jgi:hypothetical protein